MKGIWTWTFALIAALGLAACDQSHRSSGSSGSNWLTCETVQDCSEAPEAARCSAEGFCEDARGQRIAISTDAGVPKDAETEMVMPPMGDSGNPEPTPTEPMEPAPVPVEPHKLADVPAGGTATVSLHLYVSNQSFENDLVDIAVEIAGTRVVTGDFAVEGQHNWYAFDIQVPAGSLEIAVDSDAGDAEHRETIEVPAERWVVIDYWYYPDDPKGKYFTLSVHEQPVGFD